jgi:RNA-binding protein YhbY
LIHVSSGLNLNDLPLPSERYQQALPSKDKKARRAQAETLAKDKRLIKVQVGEKGITQNVVDSCLDVLMKHGFVRVKLGTGAGYERKEAQQQLEQLLDSVSVSAVGFTVTFYRQPGLPPPSNYKQGSSSSSSCSNGPTAGSSSSSSSS